MTCSTACSGRASAATPSSGMEKWTSCNRRCRRTGTRWNAAWNRQAIRTDDDFARHGAGEHVQVAGLHGGKDVHAGRIEVGVDAAGAPALRAVMAGGPPVDRARENRQARRDARNLYLVASQLHQPLVAARRGRG